jgi:hypothetical protein
MLQRDKVICLFDVDGTLTVPMKVSFVFVTGGSYRSIKEKRIEWGIEESV